MVTRFDTSDGGFVAFDRDLTIRTYFRPNDGAAYFDRSSSAVGACMSQRTSGPNDPVREYLRKSGASYGVVTQGAARTGRKLGAGWWRRCWRG